MRATVPTGNPWGDIVGYSRAVRAGNLIFVSGTTSAGADGKALHPGEPGPQTRVILERIEAALKQLGASLEHVVETRIYVCDMDQWEAVARAHGAVFGNIRPASTLVEVKRLIASDMLVEISATAVLIPLRDERSEESIPEHQDSGVVAVEIARVGRVMHPVVRTGVEYIFEPARHALHGLGMNPKLVK